MTNRALIATIVFGLTASAFAQNGRKPIRAEHKFTISQGGSFILENPVGSIDIVGVDTPDIGATTFTTIVARTPEAYEEARKQTTVVIGGDTRKRVLRSNSAPNRTADWRANVDWAVRLPRSAHVRVISQTSVRIRVMNMAGNVHVSNVNGNVVLHNITGSAVVESINGSLVYSAPQLGGDATLSTVNGHVTASVVPDGDFYWIADTVRGDIRTNFPAKGTRNGNTYRATVNAPGGPTIKTSSTMGSVFLYEQGKTPVDAISVTRRAAAPGVTPVKNGPIIVAQPILVDFQYRTTLGNVMLREIYGNADISTGAGEVSLERVRGWAKIASSGGPLKFGEILGVLTASTGAGDISAETVRRGGTIATQGGTIRVTNVFGPTRFHSGGGDIIVQRAAAPIKAETSSGDIAITLDASSKTENIEAKTSKGNIVLRVAPGFAADVDATIVTTNPDADSIESDIPGLSVSRDQIGNKTRFRAVGKLNGGGERLVLEAVNGDIRISTGAK